MRLIYLAGPYTHPDAEVREERLRQNINAVAYFMKTAPNLFLYSPIINCAEVAKSNDLPHDFSYWAERDFFMIRKSSAMWILTIPGWKDSFGLQEETEFAIDINKPIVYVVQESTKYVLMDDRP